MANRKDSIEQLLQEAFENISIIGRQQKQAIADISVQVLGQTKVFNTLNALRTCLDYCAKDIYESVIQPHLGPFRNKIYFPYAPSQADFLNSIHRNGFDQLFTYNSCVYTLVESIQPFPPHDDWLYWLCHWNNDNKHDDLSDQKRVNGVDLKLGKVTLRMPDGAKMVVQNDLIIGDMHFGPVEIENGKVKTKASVIDFPSTKWSKFIFTENNKDVIDFLNLVKKSVEKFVGDLYSII